MAVGSHISGAVTRIIAPVTQAHTVVTRVPGYPTHLFVQRRIAQAGKNEPGPLGDSCKLMLDHPDIAAMGSHGPDITFFLDLMPVAQQWLQRGIEIYELINRFVEPFNEAIGAVKDVVDRAASGIIPGYDPLKAAYQQFGDTFDMLGNTFMTGLAAFATGYIDVFAYLKLPMQRGLREEGWYWFDMVHYRRTSQFARNLFLAAGDDPRLKAYAAGYSTHLATDVTGHAYVNACAGGPYRTQWQRHHCCDNYVDVWTLSHYESVDINQSKWHRNYPREMPPKVRGQFLTALDQTYKSLRHPDGRLLEGREWPNHGDLERMWQMLYMAMEMQTDGYSVKRPSPPDFPIDFESFPAPPDYEATFGGGRRRGGFSWKALFEALWNFIKDTFSYIHDVIKWVVDSLVATSLWPFQYALYLIQLGIYQVYRAFRRVLALRGYCYAHPDELVGGGKISSGFGGTLAGALLVGTEDLDYDAEKTYYIPSHKYDAGFPHTEGTVNSPKLMQDAVDRLSEVDDSVKVLIEACLAAGGFPQAFQTPWKYPDTALEPQRTYNAPYENGSLPDAFLEKAVFSRKYYEAFKNVGSVSQMLGLSAAASESWRSCLGNAVDLGKAMLTDIAGDGSAPDFNLDGDRGYGWLCWDIKPLGEKDRKVGSYPPSELVIGPSVGTKGLLKPIPGVRILKPKLKPLPRPRGRVKP